MRVAGPSLVDARRLSRPEWMTVIEAHDLQLILVRVRESVKQGFRMDLV